MRLNIRAKQIAAVTAIVGLSVVGLSAVYVARLSRLVLHESQARGELLANAIFHRAREVVSAKGDPYAALHDDPGLRAILESSIYGENVTFAAILDTDGNVRVSSDPGIEGRPLAENADLPSLVNASTPAQLAVIYSREGRTLEVRQAMMLGDQAFGSIRIGVSTVLMRQELNASLLPAINIALLSLVIAVIVAALIAQLFLKPINVIRSGLTRLGKGEFGVTLDLNTGDEFADLGTFFNTVSKQLSADRLAAAEHRDPRVLARKLVALSRLTAGLAHEVKNPLNAMMIHLELLRTKIKRTVTRPEPAPVAAGGLGLAEAHSSDGAKAEEADSAMQHVEIIESEIRRLDEVVQGFLKFTRPEELRLQPTKIHQIFEEIFPVIAPEAERNNVRIEVDVPATVPAVQGDSALLRQAFLNLAINACQAMSNGGTLHLSAAPVTNNRVEVRFEDTGIGIPAEHLDKIFDLYFTTKDHGTGIGLSMVYRIVQLHDGDIEVESIKGRGTTFRVLLPRANEM
jgi:signal transduction histidine kinase